MPAITKNGRELADTLRKLGASGGELELICSRICKHAVTHCHFMEAACNRELTESELRAEKNLEDNLSKYIGQIDVRWGDKDHDHSAMLPVFQGDPRGFTVRLRLPDGYPNRDRLGNTWGLGGEYGV